MNILLGITGSVAATKYPLLYKQLTSLGEVKVVTTEKGWYFASRSQDSLPNAKVYVDKDEWEWEEKGNEVLHIALRSWADVAVIAPLSAHTLAKIAGGLCDNLLTSVLRAWDPTKPLIVAPAMNTYMWDHPLTITQLDSLKKLYRLTIVNPITKTLACGDTGIGALASESAISEAVLAAHSS